MMGEAIDHAIRAEIGYRQERVAAEVDSVRRSRRAKAARAFRDVFVPPQRSGEVRPARTVAR